MRTNWIARLARSRLASSPRSFDMLGGASSLSSSSSVVVRSFVGCFFVLASRIVIPPGAVRPSSCPAAWLSVRLCLLASYAPRVSSAHPLPTGFAACLIRLSFSSAHRLAFLPRIARLPAPSTSGAGRNHNRRRGGGGEWLTAAAWLLAYPGWRREVIGCGWRRAAGVMALLSVRGRPACLPSWRWTGRLGHLFSPISSAHPIGYDPPGHPIDGEGVSFPFRPTPSRLLFSVCLPGACSPVPGRGMCRLRHGLRRRAGGLVRLLAIVPVPLSHCVRSLVAICSVSLASLCLLVALWGVLRAISSAYLSALAFLNICP